MRVTTGISPCFSENQFHIADTVHLVANRITHYRAPDWWINESRLNGDAGNYCDERRLSVGAVARDEGVPGEFEYCYDMGDGWTHRIVIEQAAATATLGLPLPRCVFDSKGFDLNRINREWRPGRKKR